MGLQHCASMPLPPRYYPHDSLNARLAYSPVSLPDMVPRRTHLDAYKPTYILHNGLTSPKQVRKYVEGVSTDLLDDLRPGMLDETLAYMSPSKYAGTFGPSMLTPADKEAAIRQLLVNTKARPFQPATSTALPEVSNYQRHMLGRLQELNPDRARAHLATMPYQEHAKVELARRM